MTIKKYNIKGEEGIKNFAYYIIKNEGILIDSFDPSSEKELYDFRDTAIIIKRKAYRLEKKEISDSDIMFIGEKSLIEDIVSHFINHEKIELEEIVKK